MKKILQSWRKLKLIHVAPAVFALIFAGIGSSLLLSTHAATLTGDLNGDSTVNIFDLSIFLTHWQQSGSGQPEDFNGDNTVNIFDLSIILSHYGQTATATGPVLSVNGNTISWPTIAGATNYQGAISNGPGSDSGRATSYSDLGNVTSWSPPSDCGKTDYYGVSDNADGQWSASEVSITWSACTGGSGNVTISMNGNGLCYGKPAYLPTYHLWQRANYEQSCDSPSTLKANGIHISTVVIGNTLDETMLSNITIGNGTGTPDAASNWLAYAESEVDDAIANGGASVPLEVGNEMYLKGGSNRPSANYADPAKYAHMFVALANARPNANLLFSSFGDYQRADSSWSGQSSGGGWLGDAIAAEPTLATKVKGFVNHPYGNLRPSPNNSFNSYGPNAIVAQHDYAVSRGYTNSNKWYLTEYGSSYPTASDGDSQAADCQYAFNWFMGLADAQGVHYVKNITWFADYDYNGMNPVATGSFNADWSPRPIMSTLQAFAIAQGQ